MVSATLGAKKSLRGRLMSKTGRPAADIIIIIIPSNKVHSWVQTTQNETTQRENYTHGYLQTYLTISAVYPLCTPLAIQDSLINSPHYYEQERINDLDAEVFTLFKAH